MHRSLPWVNRLTIKLVFPSASYHHRRIVTLPSLDEIRKNTSF